MPGNIASAPLPYDLYVAAHLYLSSGRREDEVLGRLGLSPTAWRRLDDMYLSLLHDGDPSRLRPLHEEWPHLSSEHLVAALVGPRWHFHDGLPATDDALFGIREKVLAQPRIGPFAEVDWIAVRIVDDPVAWLRYYSRDDEKVFFRGQPLADRGGAPHALDAATFRHVGGRWYTDGRLVLGQGELRGPRYQLYWWVLEGADAGSFQALNLRYAKDAHRAWYITGKTIRTKSPAAFEIVPDLQLNWVTGSAKPVVAESLLARDAEHVYSYGARVRLADPARFRALGLDYFSDGIRVWREDGKILVEDADGASFLVPSPSDPPIEGTGGRTATDRTRPWERGEPRKPEAQFEFWRAYFVAHPELKEYWWWRLAAQRESAEREKLN